MTKLVPLPWLDYCEDEISEGPHKMLRYSVVAFATSQQDETSGDPVMALYLCRAHPTAKYAEAESEIDPLEYTAFLAPSSQSTEK